MEALDFDLDLEAPAAPKGPLKADEHETMTGQPKAPLPARDKALDFDFDLGDTATVVNPTPGMDLSSISLDLDVAPVTAPAAPVEQPAPDSFGGGDQSLYQEVATKLELAQAYEEMGDREGARELLQEVLAEGNAEQQEAARNKLAVLA
jgi:pilus assembly protein FimV